MSNQPAHTADAAATAVLEPLAGDRARIERIVARLDTSDDPTERADLAAELSRSVSRYEDTVEQVLAAHPRGEGVRQLEQGRGQLRDVLSVIHERTMHMDPRNVHAGDPDGFERALDEAATSLRRHLDAEDACLRRLVRTATRDEQEAIGKQVRKAVKTASERPHPPRTTLGRIVSNLNVKLDHTLEDVANPRHPGADTIDGR